MVRVEQAEEIILSEAKDYGIETLPFDDAVGRVLAEDIAADRDIPPYNRVTMDGIAVNYEAITKGMRSFQIKATQAAGDSPVEINNPEECIEEMTGAALPSTVDTIIRYEDLEIKNGIAIILKDVIVTKGQNIHYRGEDKKQGEIVLAKNQFLTPAVMNVVAAVGKTKVVVKKMPRVVILSSGDELIDVNETPAAYQIRRSNNYAVKAVLQMHCVPADMLHTPDNASITREHIAGCLQQYEIIILSGGVSMGKFDYVPQALKELEVQKLFHKVQQKPGKPFWFGKHKNGVLVFAFPGNPVSTFMCLHRYFIPWLEASLGIHHPQNAYAILDEDVSFTPVLQYFLQVQLNVNENGCLLATPVEGHGSGDFANLVQANAFMELPASQSKFTKGEVFKTWPFKQIIG